MVMNCIKDDVKTLGNLVEILQGQLTLVELPINENIVDDLLHQPFDPGGGGIIKSARGGLHGIG